MSSIIAKIKCRINRVWPCSVKQAEDIAEQLKDLRNLMIYNHPITGVQKAVGKLRLLQEGNVALLKYFARKLESIGLSFWLDYGTLLGAVRHQGFIPWDEDLDVSMMHADFEKLLEHMSEFFPEEEGFTSKLNAYGFLQIGYQDTPLNLDVYPYFFNTQSITAERAAAINKGIDAVKLLVSKRLKNKPYTRAEVQRLVEENIPGGTTQSTEGTPAIFLAPSIIFTKNTVLAFEDIFPLKTMVFEEKEYMVPNHTRQYLQFMFGDYMAYPPKVGYQHSHLEDLVNRMPFEAVVNRFIDKYGE